MPVSEASLLILWIPFLAGLLVIAICQDIILEYIRVIIITILQVDMVLAGMVVFLEVMAY